MKNIFFLALLFFFISPLFSQVITIDAQFDDWSSIPVLTDPQGDDSNLDLIECSVTHDADYIYFRVKTVEEFGLMNPPYTNSQLRLFIDTDNDPSTGASPIGSELTVYFGSKRIDFDYPQVGAHLGNLYDIGFQAGPTTTGTEFEIAIRRESRPDQMNRLLHSNTINFQFFSTGGDYMPNGTGTFSHSLTSGSFPAYPPIEAQKDDPSYLRLLAYNVRGGGLSDQSRSDNFERVVKGITPDIIGFSEVSASASDVKKLLDVWIPIANGWYTDNNGSNVIASRYPILFSEAVYPGDTRSVAALIDLPNAAYAKDILVIAAHPSCCSNDVARQEQIDRMVSYIIDAKNPGGQVNIPPNTPISLIGDFNLVGLRQQLQTIIEGDIVNTGLYGAGAPLDWDGSDMESASCLHTHRPSFFTWRNRFSSFGPGKLDYIFYSGSEMEEMKSFTFDTFEMPAPYRSQYGVSLSDTDRASDHLPLVADFKLDGATGIEELASTFRISPNPASHFMQISQESPFPSQGLLLDIHGKKVMEFEMTGTTYSLDISALPQGLYLLKMTTHGHEFHNKLLKK
jgi:endonuclease/exonuclease/phosphatase family metal-dependent hydrolase